MSLQSKCQLCCSHLKAWIDWRIHFLDLFLLWLLAGDVSSSPYGPLHKTAHVSSRQGNWLPQSEWPKKESHTEAGLLYGPASEITLQNFHHIHMPGESSKPDPPWKGGKSGPMTWREQWQRIYRHLLESSCYFLCYFLSKTPEVLLGFNMD